MVLYYKNSILASLVSIMGCFFVMFAFAMFSEGDIGSGILSLIFAVPFLVGGKWISKNKAFKKWWKQVINANLVPEIAKSTSIAVEIYKKNPESRTLKKIQEINPEAAAYIRNNFNVK